MYKAKERASVLWLLSKAYNKNIPVELQEPYYKNAQDEDTLKPQIIQGLTTCELYCMALSYIYEDSNYADLDHIGVIQLLIKKGISIIEPADFDITETALVQNAPIRMAAHMAIIDAIMSLFSKDILIPEKIVEVVSRFAPIEAEEVPLDLEEVALFWLNKCSERYRQIIEDELNNNEAESLTYIPCLPYIQDITELNSGCSLVALLSFYCPSYLNWREVVLKEQDEMTPEDSIKNIETVQYFCAKFLPYDICFIETENFLKIKNTMRVNILTFISDLLYLFEVKPASCVKRPEFDINELDYDYKENERINHNNNLTTLDDKKMRDLVAAELRSRSLQHTSWTNDEEENNLNQEILNQQHNQKRLKNYLKMQQQNYDTIDFYSNEDKQKKSSFSRAQKKINHDLQSLNLNKDSSSENEFYINQQTLKGRNNLNNLENLNSNLNNQNSDGSETSSTLSFAKLSKIKAESFSQNLNSFDNPSINVIYSSDQDDCYKTNQKNTKKQNSRNYISNSDTNGNAASSDQEESEIANQILQLHLKLEEKRKQIELQRNQMESYYINQKRDISNEAFLKALKIEKINNETSNLKKDEQLDAFELKEDLNSLKKSFPLVESSKSDQFYNDVKSSIDILSSSVIDLEKDLNLLEEEKLIVRQQKKNLDQLLIDQQFKKSDNQLPKSESESKFFLHNEKMNNNQLNELLNNSMKNDSNQQSLNDYLNHTQILSHDNYMNKSNKQFNLMNDSLTSLVADSLTNSTVRRSSINVDKNIENCYINDDNNEKGFFISFDNEDSKVKSRPKTFMNRNLKDDKEICKINDLEIKPDPVGFVIGNDLVSPDPKSEFEKAKKKEFIMNQSMKRKAEQEEKLRLLKEEMMKKCEEDRKKREQIEKRKEENRMRREAILEQHRLRKLQEESEKDGGVLTKLESKSSTLRNRSNLSNLNRSRPKSIHISSNMSNVDSTSNFTSLDFRSKLVSDHLDAALINYPSSVISNFSSYNNSLRPQSSMSNNSAAIKKLYMNNSSKHNLPSLPPFMLGSRLQKGSGSSDGVSEIGSTYSEYTGPKLYVKPTQKSNRGIIVNAINVVLGGAVNVPTKKKVLEEISKNDSKHFLILFRGNGMQFRAIYTYNPDCEEVIKLFGTGPKAINNDMIDKFYKYNSGGKNFNEVHTKHLTVTIDAVTIHSQLWTGKKIIPVKKDNF